MRLGCLCLSLLVGYHQVFATAQAHPVLQAFTKGL